MSHHVIQHPVHCPACGMNAQTVAVNSTTGSLHCIDCGGTFDTRHPERWSRAKAPAPKPPLDGPHAWSGAGSPAYIAV